MSNSQKAAVRPERGQGGKTPQFQYRLCYITDATGQPTRSPSVALTSRARP